MALQVPEWSAGQGRERGPGGPRASSHPLVRHRTDQRALAENALRNAADATPCACFAFGTTAPV
jgi:hypothetical protein